MEVLPSVNYVIEAHSLLWSWELCLKSSDYWHPVCQAVSGSMGSEALLFALPARGSLGRALSWKSVGDTGFPSLCALTGNSLPVGKHDFIVILILTFQPHYCSVRCTEQASRRAAHSEGRVGVSDHLDHGRSHKLRVQDTALLLWRPPRKPSALLVKAAGACSCTSAWRGCSWSQNFLHCSLPALYRCCNLSCGKSRTSATSSGWMRCR